MDTIFALASGRGKAGVSVIRVSGPAAPSVLASMVGNVPERAAALRKLWHDGVLLDEALVLYFPKPASFTGEDVVEFHLHGSLATVAAVSAALGSFKGVRQAEAGEFTRRALENEKLDLAQIEGLADLIEAETEAQRKQALRVFSGAMGEKAARWRQNLIRAAALIEATIDFVDEDVPTDVTPEVVHLLASVVSDIRDEIDGAVAAERIRDGFEVAIVGPPNVGKSTLLNALAGRDAAITSEVAGTTRDVLEVRMDLMGLPVTFLDTAGLRDTEDEVEAIGVARARSRADLADLRLILCHAGDAPALSPLGDDLVVAPKSDLGEGDFSAITGDGLTELVNRITNTLAARAASPGIAIRGRHRTALEKAILSLEMAQDQITTGAGSAEIVADELRTAVRVLDSLVGHIGVEDLLDEIFASFCIGK